MTPAPPRTIPSAPIPSTRYPDDGAALPWSAGSVFCNPLYGEARVRWVRRCVEAGAAGSRVVLLIPAHTDTRIWHEAMGSATSLLFIKGRVKFGLPRANGRQVAASHPSALVGWNVDLRLADDLGAAVHLRDQVPTACVDIPLGL
ncbi:DNA N-6-adenine-methyltransferase [Nocardioides sp. BE266]|uniref:DNA N-6-adenine-methyltransferase n=1 Tax=Nocardioides sp. BE266 TaxID=2817725 RepID=UPI00286CF977|nr:DNA N-6-adenine-methyltransferase [Nocardioides sp. BE266]